MHLACSGLRDSLSRNATVVVSSATLAAATREDLSRSQLEAGSRSWERPGIYTIDAWLERCWQEVRYEDTNTPALLSPSQELLVWRQLIEHEHADLFDVSACARGARDAARTLAQWHISIDKPASAEHWNAHQDASQFLKWLGQFEEICAKNGWMSRAHLWNRVPGWFAKGNHAKADVGLVGFEDWSPALQAIVNASGARRLQWDTPVPPSRK